MADYILIALQWWLAYLCCAAQYGYAEWCEVPWMEDAHDMKSQFREDKRGLKRLTVWVQNFRKDQDNG